MQNNVSNVLGELLTKIRVAQREVSLQRDGLQQDEAILQLLSLNEKLLQIEASIISEIPKTEKIVGKLLKPMKRPGRPKKATPKAAAKAPKTTKKQPKVKTSAPKKRGRKPKAVAAKAAKPMKKPGRRGRSVSSNYTGNWVIGYSILKMLSMFKDKQAPKLVIYVIDKVLNPILTKDDKKESKAAKQRGYEGVWATHLSDSIHRERRSLLEAGLIEKKVPTGVWKISAKGKQALKTPQKLADVYSSFEISKLPAIAKMFAEDEKKIKGFVKEFEAKQKSTRGKKATKAKTAKPKAKTTAKKKPGRPKAIKAKTAKPKAKTTPKTKAATKAKTAKPKVKTAAKKKPGRPKGSKNKTPKATVEKKPIVKKPAVKKAKHTPKASPMIKRPATGKNKVKTKPAAKPLHKDLAKRKPGRPPKSAKKSPKDDLKSKIEKKMAEKEKVEKFNPPAKPAKPEPIKDKK